MIGPTDRVLYMGKCALKISGGLTETRLADGAFYTKEGALSTSQGLGQGLDLQIGSSIQVNVH